MTSKNKENLDVMASKVAVNLRGLSRKDIDAVLRKAKNKALAKRPLREIAAECFFPKNMWHRDT